MNSMPRNSRSITIYKPRSMGATAWMRLAELAAKQAALKRLDTILKPVEILQGPSGQRHRVLIGPSTGIQDAEPLPHEVDQLAHARV